MPQCSLKNQSRFSRAVGQRLHSSMIKESASVKYRLPDTDPLESLRQKHSHLFGSLDLFRTLRRSRQLLTQRRCLRQGPPLIIRDGLHIDMRCRPKYAETWIHLGPEHLSPDPLLPFQSYLFDLLRCQCPTPSPSAQKVFTRYSGPFY